MLNNRRKKTQYLLYKNRMILQLNKLESPSIKNALWQFWLKLTQWFLRRFVNVFCYFVIISPWKRAGPSLEQTWIQFTQRCDELSLVEIRPVILEKKIFKFRHSNFCYFVIISPWKKGGILHLKKRESPPPEDALYQV